MQISAKLLVGLSLVATAATIANALLMHKQFFPSMLHITKSNASMAVCTVNFFYKFDPSGDLFPSDYDCFHGLPTSKTNLLWRIACSRD